MVILFTIAECASGMVICSNGLNGKDVSQSRKYYMRYYNACPIDRTQYTNFRLKINKFSTRNHHESKVRIGVDVGEAQVSHYWFEVDGKTSYFTSVGGNPLYLSGVTGAATADSIQVWAYCVEDYGFFDLNRVCEFDFNWEFIADTAPPPPSPPQLPPSPPPLPPSPPPLPPSPAPTNSDKKNNLAPSPAPTNSDKKNNLGLIVGIVGIVAGAAVGVAALALAFCYLKKKKEEGAIGHAVAAPVGLAVNVPPPGTNTK